MAQVAHSELSMKKAGPEGHWCMEGGRGEGSTEARREEEERRARWERVRRRKVVRVGVDREEVEER